MALPAHHSPWGSSTTSPGKLQREVREIEKSLYVDDLISGGPTQAKAETIKLASVEIFAKRTFELHKWHSNMKELEQVCSVTV